MVIITVVKIKMANKLRLIKMQKHYPLQRGKNFLKLLSVNAMACVVLFVPTFSNANIEFSEDALAPESVLPVFPRSVYVKNRNVEKRGAIEIQALGGISVNNPFFKSYPVGGSVGYYFTEEHGVQFLFGYLMSRKSGYASSLENYTNVLEPNSTLGQANFDNFPSQKMLGLISYEYSPFYGKLSLAKGINFNIDVVTSVGGGMFYLEDGSFPTASLGLGLRVYFGKTFGLRINMYSLFRKGINYFPLETNEAATNNFWSIKKTTNDLRKVSRVDVLANFGMVVLL